MDYYENIKENHCVVSFSESKRVYYICLWNGVLRDGKVDDIDIEFIETPDIKITNDTLVCSNKNVSLSSMHLQHLTSLFSKN